MKKFILGLFGLGFLFLLPNSVLGCSCVRRDLSLTYKQLVVGELKTSSVVFSGKVKSIEYNGSLQSVKFEVNESWKGISSDEIIIYANKGNGANCGYTFAIDNTYLIYANKNRGKLWTSSCTFTKWLDDAKKDIEALGKGKTPKLKRKT